MRIVKDQSTMQKTVYLTLPNILNFIWGLFITVVFVTVISAVQVIFNLKQIPIRYPISAYEYVLPFIVIVGGLSCGYLSIIIVNSVLVLFIYLGTRFTFIGDLSDVLFQSLVLQIIIVTVIGIYRLKSISDDRYIKIVEEKVQRETLGILASHKAINPAWLKNIGIKEEGPSK